MIGLYCLYLYEANVYKILFILLFTNTYIPKNRLHVYTIKPFFPLELNRNIDDRRIEIIHQEKSLF
jgi:hypothetical protein